MASKAERETENGQFDENSLLPHVFGTSFRRILLSNDFALNPYSSSIALSHFIMQARVVLMSSASQYISRQFYDLT